MLTVIGKLLTDPLRVREAFDAHQKAVAKALEVLAEPDGPRHSCNCGPFCGAPADHECTFKRESPRRTLVV